MDCCERILIDEGSLAKRVSEMAGRINADYEGKRLTVVGILKGSFVFIADLMRRITLENVEVDFMKVSSYGPFTDAMDAISVTQDLDADVRDKHVLIVEDILDTGRTIAFLLGTLKARGPASVKVCALMDKPGRRLVEIEADYTGFRIPDEFVVGYGLDYAQKYRHLPYIGVLRKDLVK